MARNNYRVGHGGFTLMELLVSVSVMAVMIALVYASFSRAATATARTEEFMDLNHVSRFIGARMADDLASAAIFPNNKKAFFLGEMGNSEEGGRMDAVSFTGYGRRLVVPGTASDQAIISWFARKNPDKDTYTLFRGESWNTLGEDEKERETGVFDVTDSLVALEINYLRIGAQDKDWKDSFDSKETGQTPDAVSVKFTLRNEAGSEITRSALIPVGGKL